MKPVIWINLDPEKIDLTCLAERLGEKYRLIARAIPGKDPQEVRRQALEADVVISILEKWDAAQLAAVKGRVRLIQKYGMGLDNIDVEEASRLGIYVANVVGANSAAVAETALLHILNAGRKFTPCVSGVKAGVWPSTITGTELDGKIIGLLGCGNIARHLARMLSGFQVEILAYDPYVSQEQAPENVCMVQSREMLFAASDIISLHIPCTKETAGSINRECFRQMKKGVYLINTCRGGVINEEDLAEALRDGTVAAAGLDVLREEPPAPDNPLLKMDQVFVTSHMGAESAEAGYRSQMIMADTIERFLDKGELSRFVQNRGI